MRWEGDFERFARMRALSPPSILGWSQLAHRLTAAFAAAPEDRPAPDEKRPRVPVDKFRELLAEVRAETERRGIEMLLISWPARFNVLRSYEPTDRTPYQIATAEFGSELRLGFVDGVEIAQRLREQHKPREIFLDHVHGTALTNDHVARALAEKLGPWIRQRIDRGSRR